MLKAEGIKKRYGQLEVLKGIDLEISKGEVVAIVGSSGAGKSTLLHILGTLDVADVGRLIINDLEINKLSKAALANFRNRQIGFVFQFHHLLPEFTVYENIMIPAMIGNNDNTDTRQWATELLDFFGLKDRAHHKPNELSGGEAQRVAVARALINKPSLICADEPSGNLDSENAQALHRLFFELRTKYKQTFIIVTHNEQLAQQADRVLHMIDGRIEEPDLALAYKPNAEQGV